MIFMFIIPSVPAAMGNIILPVMLGTKDVAFPRLNLASWYIYVVGSLIGAIVGEFVIGPISGHSGLAYRIIESGYQLEIPKMFASVFLISVTGIILFNLANLLSYLILKDWHESFSYKED